MQKTYFEYFDTFSTISSYADESEESFQENCELVRSLLEKYHRLFDIYYEYSGVVNLKTLNESAAISPVTVDRELFDFLVYAKEMYIATRGEMNIAMGAVLRLWHDCRENAEAVPQAARVPSEDELSAAAGHTSIDSLVLDGDSCTVYFSDSELRLDVGALGKGYAVEMVSELLRQRNVSAYILNVGGNISAIGAKTNGKGWITGITNPDKSSSDSLAARIELKNASCVTSGNYERFYTVDGRKYHHIIDKDTNMPAEYFASVSVVAKNSALADALSTALFCMSYEDGKALVDNMEDVEVLWISHNGEQRATRSLPFFKKGK